MPDAAEAPFFAPGASGFPSLPRLFIAGGIGRAPGLTGGVFMEAPFAGAPFAGAPFAGAPFAGAPFAGVPFAITALTGAAFAAIGFPAGFAGDLATTLAGALGFAFAAAFATGRDDPLCGGRFFELAAGLRAAGFATARARGFAAFAFARAPDLREVAMVIPPGRCGEPLR